MKKKYHSVSFKLILVPIILIFVLGYNPRHLNRHQKDLYRERPVFKQWIGDTPEIVAAMLAHDKNHWDLRRICLDNKEYNHLETIIVHNFGLLTDTYHYLQQASNRYPWVSYYTARKYFFEPFVTLGGYSVDSEVYDSMVR